MKHEMTSLQHLLMVTLLGIELSKEDERWIQNGICADPTVVPNVSENNSLAEFQQAMKFNYQACIATQADTMVWRRAGDEKNPKIIFRTVDDYLNVYPLK